MANTFGCHKRSCTRGEPFSGRDKQGTHLRMCKSLAQEPLHAPPSKVGSYRLEVQPYCCSTFVELHKHLCLGQATTSCVLVILAWPVEARHGNSSDPPRV